MKRITALNVFQEAGWNDRTHGWTPREITCADIKALAAYLNAVSDEPPEGGMHAIGPFKIQLSVVET